MHVRDLPHMKRIGASADQNGLARLIRKGLDGSYVCAYEVVAGGPCSIRVFLTRFSGNAVSLPGLTSPQTLARELMLFSREQARYPDRPSVEGKLKGWELRTTVVDSKRALIAIAAWV